MSWKKYFQIITIILIGAGAVYFLMPKYSPVSQSVPQKLQEIAKVSPPVVTKVSGPLVSEDSKKYETSKITKAKMEIEEAFQEYEKKVNGIVNSFPQKSESLVNKYIAQGLVYQGDFTDSQMELALNTKKELDKRILNLQITMEDILRKYFSKKDMAEAFSSETQRLQGQKIHLQNVYQWLSQYPKELEMKTFKELTVTRDFDVTRKPAFK